MGPSIASPSHNGYIAVQEGTWLQCTHLNYVLMQQADLFWFRVIFQVCG